MLEQILKTEKSGTGGKHLGIGMNVRSPWRRQWFTRTVGQNKSHELEGKIIGVCGNGKRIRRSARNVGRTKKSKYKI